MPKRNCPAAVERTQAETIAVWFPDFPDCVAAASTQDPAMQKAEHVLQMTIAKQAEGENALPAPSLMETMPLPRSCNVIALALIGAELPDPSERVNIYLPRRLLAEADNYAKTLGMSSSSFFGLAISIMIDRRPPLPSERIALSPQG